MPAECCKEFWNRIPDDEPVFILAARDLTAPDKVRDWITTAKAANTDADKVRRAEEHLAAFETFQREHPERCKMPD